MMKTIWQRTVPMLAALTALAACSSTPTVYYQLPDSAFVSANTPKQTVWTNVYVVLAEPLNRQSLLYQSDGHTVQMTQHNLWAAPLSNGLAAAVANKLNRQSSLHFRPAEGAAKSPAITLFIDRFQGSYLGQTEIRGYARLPNGSIRAFHAVTPQKGDGYAAMLESLNQGLDDVARQLQ